METTIEDNRKLIPNITSGKCVLSSENIPPVKPNANARISRIPKIKNAIIPVNSKRNPIMKDTQAARIVRIPAAIGKPVRFIVFAAGAGGIKGLAQYGQ